MKIHTLLNRLLFCITVVLAFVGKNTFGMRENGTSQIGQLKEYQESIYDSLKSNLDSVTQALEKAEFEYEAVEQAMHYLMLIKFPDHVDAGNVAEVKAEFEKFVSFLQENNFQEKIREMIVYVESIIPEAIESKMLTYEGIKNKIEEQKIWINNQLNSFQNLINQKKDKMEMLTSAKKEREDELTNFIEALLVKDKITLVESQILAQYSEYMGKKHNDLINKRKDLVLEARGLGGVIWRLGSMIIHPLARLIARSYPVHKCQEELRYTKGMLDKLGYKEKSDEADKYRLLEDKNQIMSGMNKIVNWARFEVSRLEQVKNTKRLRQKALAMLNQAKKIMQEISRIKWVIFKFESNTTSRA
ncbi:hypothetical protein KC460_03940 [Candidatus Dependentiae bacterium]|nr:hypothetical protein [Candidatus Dependentiae bacterium]